MEIGYEQVTVISSDTVWLQWFLTSKSWQGRTGRILDAYQVVVTGSLAR